MIKHAEAVLTAFVILSAFSLVGAQEVSDNRLSEAAQHSRRGELTEAIAIYKALIANHPSTDVETRARLDLGVALGRAGELEKAQTQFKDVLDSVPANSSSAKEARRGLLVALVQAGQYEEAYKLEADYLRGTGLPEAAINQGLKDEQALIDHEKVYAPERKIVRNVIGLFLSAIVRHDAKSLSGLFSFAFSDAKRRQIQRELPSSPIRRFDLEEIGITFDAAVKRASVRVVAKATEATPKSSIRTFNIQLSKYGKKWKIDAF